MFFILFILVGSCKEQSSEVELEILNNEFVCYSGNNYSYFNEKYEKKALTKYRYKIKNNSSKKYVFNLDVFSTNFVAKRKEYFNEKDILIFSSDEDTLDVVARLTNPKSFEFNKKYLNFLKRNLGNRFLEATELTLVKANNFTINPGESKYFENYVILPSGSDYNPCSIKLKDDNNYYVNIKIWSDSTSVKEYFDDSELRTFKENDYEFFHGTITSKNKVPLKMVK